MPQFIPNEKFEKVIRELKNFLARTLTNLGDFPGLYGSDSNDRYVAVDDSEKKVKFGRRLFSAPTSPTPADGSDGDLWFEYGEEVVLWNSNGYYGSYLWRWHSLSDLADISHIMPMDPPWFDDWDDPHVFLGAFYHEGYIYALRNTSFGSALSKIDPETGETVADRERFWSNGFANWVFTSQKPCTDGTYVYVCDQTYHRIVKYLLSDLSFVSEFYVDDLMDSPEHHYEVHPQGSWADDDFIYVMVWGKPVAGGSQGLGPTRVELWKIRTSDWIVMDTIGDYGSGNSEFSTSCNFMVSDGLRLYIFDQGNSRVKVHSIVTLAYDNHFDLEDVEALSTSGMLLYGGSIYVTYETNTDHVVRIRKYDAMPPYTLQADYADDSGNEWAYWSGNGNDLVAAPIMTWANFADEVTIPAGVTELVIEAFGHGGKGGPGNMSRGGGGGGGGAFGRRTIAVAAGERYYAVYNTGSDEHTEIYKEVEGDDVLVLSVPPGADGTDNSAGAGGAAGDCVNADVAYSGGDGEDAGAVTRGGHGGNSAGKFVDGNNQIEGDLEGDGPLYGAPPCYSGIGGNNGSSGNQGADGDQPGGGGGGSGLNKLTQSTGGAGFAVFRYKTP